MKERVLFIFREWAFFSHNYQDLKRGIVLTIILVWRFLMSPKQKSPETHLQSIYSLLPICCHVCPHFLPQLNFWVLYPSLTWPFLGRMFFSVSITFLLLFFFVIVQSHEIFLVANLRYHLHFHGEKVEILAMSSQFLLIAGLQKRSF